MNSPLITLPNDVGLSTKLAKLSRVWAHKGLSCWERGEKRHQLLLIREWWNFLKDLLYEARKETIDEDKLIEYTDTLLQIFDSNKDGKLQLSEMAKLLPVKENFLCRSAFKGASKLTREDIERVFNLYDRDRNGTIENEELKGFLKDLLELVKKDYDAQDLEEFQEAILRGCDFNKDGKINKKELTMILLALAKHAQEDDVK
ncbi:calbindin-32 [Trichonephila inaurata madagascariensis]|uniref:Calbindin-32 n=1 Tax=Trichonephila inaurata madagascariensis TaxID=2747483 RepID=A0A8X6Y1B4_9ARAC|nr:calbindin-32 [Trichonephila inaurata madagascariensis]GFY62383.1 calbindin-32 [Trichonephila inaurata madagascariensis]